MVGTLILLFSLVAAFDALAQKGWNELPRADWKDVKYAHFFDDRLGMIVEFGDAIFMTDDGGATWKKFSYFRTFTKSPCYRSADSQYSVAIPVAWNFSKHSLVIAGGAESHGCSSGYLKSRQVWSFNGGTKQWVGAESHPASDYMYEYLDRIESVDSIIDVSTDRRIAPDATDHFMRSRDYGRSWYKFRLPGPQKYSSVVPLFISQDSGIVSLARMEFDTLLSTTDRGKTWLGVETPISRWNTSWKRVGREVFLIGVRDTFASKNLGLTWTRVNSIPVDTSTLPAGFYSKYEGYRLLHGLDSSSQINHTTDSGSTWSIQAEQLQQLRFIIAPSDRVAYAIGNNGRIYKTSDGGGRFAGLRHVSRAYESIKFENGHLHFGEYPSQTKMTIHDVMGRLLESKDVSIERLIRVGEDWPSLIFVRAGSTPTLKILLPK